MVALGAVFIKKARSNYPISLFGRTGILSRNSKIALIITLNFSLAVKKRFFLHPRRNILSYKGKTIKQSQEQVKQKMSEVHDRRSQMGKHAHCGVA